jgi:hypothetical protein
MTIAWVLVLVLLTCIFFLPVIWYWQLIAYYRSRLKPTPILPDEQLPRASIVLSLRGADPSLAHCIMGLLQQDYPPYAVRIVIDSPEDPAWEVVNKVLAQGYGKHLDMRVSSLERRLETCSLKCSSHLQALAQLDDSVEVVACLDADSIPARNWLRSMAHPLRDPNIGISSGIRWFAPRDTKWGSLVRHFYNTGSFALMYAFPMPWGGSLALRGDLARHPRLREHWARCFCEDTSTPAVLRDLGLRVEFVPQATHFNRESIDLGRCGSFLLRQLLCVRLHHPQWRLMFTAIIAQIVAQPLSVALLIAVLTLGEWQVACALLGLMGLFLGAMLASLCFGESMVREAIRERGDPAPALPLSWKIVPAVLLAQAMSVYFMVVTIFLRKVEWRGIPYALNGMDNVRLLKYQPFRPSAKALDPTQSVI